MIFSNMKARKRGRSLVKVRICKSCCIFFPQEFPVFQGVVSIQALNTKKYIKGTMRENSVAVPFGQLTVCITLCTK